MSTHPTRSIDLSNAAGGKGETLTEERNCMSAFVIEKGIPIPPVTVTRSRGKSKYPWHEMEVGDSFYAEGADARCLGSQARGNFTTRLWGNGIRVWRVK